MSDRGEGAWVYSHFPEDYRGHAVELGALDGVYLSNTRLLEEKGWDVLCIEPNPTHSAALEKNRKRVLFCACDKEPAATATFLQMGNNPPYTYGVVRYDSEPAEMQFGRYTALETTVLTLHQCLVVAGFPKLDVLSLDVDGIERDILAGIDLRERWKPKVVVIEEHQERGMADALPMYDYESRIGENGIYVRKAGV